MGGFLQNSEVVVIDPTVETISEAEAIDSISDVIQKVIETVDYLQAVVDTLNR